MNQSWILWPMVVQMLLTLVLFVPLSSRKKQAVKAGEVDAKAAALNNHEWPDYVLKVSNNIQNQFQLPVLFYALCLAFLATNGVSELVLGLAWVFAVSRIFHTYVHTTSNYVPHRMKIFILGYLCLFIMVGILISQLALG